MYVECFYLKGYIYFGDNIYLYKNINYKIFLFFCLLIMYVIN